MYAVIRTGGKQYKVEEGTVLNIEKLEVAAGDNVEIDDVLLVSDGSETKVGRPNVDGAKVNLEVVDQIRGPKQIIFKKIRRHGKQLKKGHRQNLTTVKVTGISC